MVEVPDDLQALIDRYVQEPGMKELFEKMQSEIDNLSERMCSAGNCVELYDPDTKETYSSTGPVNCKCQRRR